MQLRVNSKTTNEFLGQDPTLRNSLVNFQEVTEDTTSLGRTTLNLALTKEEADSYVMGSVYDLELTEVALKGSL